MKIGIDARFLTHPQRGGFKSYSENLVSALETVDNLNQYILYVDRSPGEQDRLPKAQNFSWKIVPGTIPGFGMPLREQISLVRVVEKDHLDIFHSPSLTAPLLIKTPLVVTIHDMIWKFPKKGPLFGKKSLHMFILRNYYRLVPTYAARKARRIISVSNSSKNDIVRHLNISENKIDITYEAANPVFRKIADANLIDRFRQKFSLPGNYLLAIGSADPRKNIRTVLQTYALFPQDLRLRFPLVIFLTSPVLADLLQQQAAQLGLKDEVLFRQQASNEEMALLYNSASLFIFASHYEGFGLPPLEAMACGTPVVASNNSSIPEVVGDSALLVNENDPKDIAEKVCRILNEPGLGAELAQKGLQQAAGFSWERCARETIAAYEKSTR